MDEFFVRLETVRVLDTDVKETNVCLVVSVFLLY